MSPAEQPGRAEQAGPIETATANLLAWLGDVTDAPVHTGLPDAGAEGTGLSAYVLALLPGQEMRSPGTSQPLRLQVRFLVTAHGPVDEANRLLDRVLVASAAVTEPALQFKALAPELWTALGVPPRPAFLVDVPGRVDRQQSVVPRVRMPLQVHDVAIRGLEGRVVGAGEVPLTGVRVELAATGASTYTNTRGGFSFSAVPADQPVRLLLRAKGRDLQAEFATAVTDDPDAGPLVIHCDLEEV